MYDTLTSMVPVGQATSSPCCILCFSLSLAIIVMFSVISPAVNVIFGFIKYVFPNPKNSQIEHFAKCNFSVGRPFHYLWLLVIFIVVLPVHYENTLNIVDRLGAKFTKETDPPGTFLLDYLTTRPSIKI